MTHPIVTALIEAVRDCVPSMDPLDEDEAKAVLGRLLRLAREPSDSTIHAICPFLEDPEECERCPRIIQPYPLVKPEVTGMRGCYGEALKTWRAGIDALTREIEGK